MRMLLSALMLFSSIAKATELKFNVEGRFDYASSTIKHEQVFSTNNFEENRMEFYSNALRVNMTATFSENLLFRMRYRFSNAQDAAAKNRDLTFQNLDLFYVDHKIDVFSTRLGKSSQADSLGREFYVASTDYPTSAYNSFSGATGYVASNSAVYNAVKNDADLYHVGATVSYGQIPNNTISVAAFTPQKALIEPLITSSVPYVNTTNTKLGLGLYYNGSFVDKMVQPTFGYTSFGISNEINATPTVTKNKVDGTNKLMSAGIRSEINGFVLDLDWKQYKKDNVTYKISNVVSISNEQTTSIWANVAYTLNNLTPFVNVISDKYDVATLNGTDYKRTAVSVGLIIKPINTVNFRYHLTYTNDVKTITWALGPNDDNKVTVNQIAAGFKFDI